MAGSTLGTFTNLLNSPLSPLVMGGVLFYGIRKFFKDVEETLAERQKVEIWWWLANLHPGKMLGSLPETFISLFDTVFGRVHLSWRCIARSAIASLLFGTTGLLLGLGVLSRSEVSLHEFWGDILSNRFEVLRLEMVSPLLYFSIGRIVAWFTSDPFVIGPVASRLSLLAILFVTNVLPDYLALYATRRILSIMVGHPKHTGALFLLGALFTFSFVSLSNATYIWLSQGQMLGLSSYKDALWLLLGNPMLREWLLYPSLLTTIWLFLYAGSGALLRTASRYEAVFNRMNQVFDLEHRPLNVIGLVSATVCVLAYWVWVFGSRALR